MLLSGAEQLGKVIKTAEQRSSSFTLDRSFIDHPSSLPKLPPYLYGLMVFVEERRTSPNRRTRVRTRHMRNGPLTREGAPREHQEEMGDGPLVGAQRGAG